jgi:hypothetical protein
MTVGDRKLIFALLLRSHYIYLQVKSEQSDRSLCDTNAIESELRLVSLSEHSCEAHQDSRKKHSLPCVNLPFKFGGCREQLPCVMCHYFNCKIGEHYASDLQIGGVALPLNITSVLTNATDAKSGLAVEWSMLPCTHIMTMWPR